jgi:hypothetical protein
VTIGFAPESLTTVSPGPRNLEAAEWTGIGTPLQANAREVVKDLHARHQPVPTTAVVAVYEPDGRIRASASFTGRVGLLDGWERRNALLTHLRRVIPHDLRLRRPVRTAVLLLCRDGPPGWTAEDGAWMWGLHDACALHGLRCGSYVTLTPDGWRVIGENHGGRTPNARTARPHRTGEPAADTSTAVGAVPTAGQPERRAAAH